MELGTNLDLEAILWRFLTSSLEFDMNEQFKCSFMKSVEET